MTVVQSTGAARRPRAVARYPQLPGPVHASSALPSAEVATFTAVVPLLGVPLLLLTMSAVPAAVATVVATALVGAVCLSRRTVVGHDWVADRRLWRFRITHADALRAVEARATGHGGVVRLHPHGSRPHRLRAAELHGPAMRSALTGVVLRSGATVTPAARSALGLPALPRTSSAPGAP
jgi:hypothetical protein